MKEFGIGNLRDNDENNVAETVKLQLGVIHARVVIASQ